MISKTFVQAIRKGCEYNKNQLSGSRRLSRFNYPHSFTGTNSALTNIPQKDVYPDLKRTGNQPGDKAQYAHQNIRVFPDWYKPYGFNYQGDGWLIFLLGSFGLLGYSYMNDIKEAKGRKSRRIFYLEREGIKKYDETYFAMWALDRVKKGDPNWTKFTDGHKQRASAHH